MVIEKRQKRYLNLHLPSCFQLLNRDLFALTREEEQPEFVWHIKETIKNGDYVRYELIAAGKKVSTGTHYDHGKALLTAAINFHPHTGKSKIFLQDFWLYPAGKGLGTLLLDLFIQFLHEWNSFFEIELIQGELSSLDEENEEDRRRRDHLYRKAGFTICEKMGRKYIQAHVRDLKRLPCRKTFILSPEEILVLIKNGLK